MLSRIMRMPGQPTRPLLILDLDETLIRATMTHLSHAPDFVVFDYAIYCRPFLSSFIAERSTIFDLAIWSAGTPEYVNKITERLFPVQIKPVFVWCRDRCDPFVYRNTEQLFYQKDLEKATTLGYPLSRIVIVEDNPINVQNHSGNALYISSYQGDPSDRELELLGPFLDQLSKHPDFRTQEKRNWRSASPW